MIFNKSFMAQSKGIGLWTGKLLVQIQREAFVIFSCSYSFQVAQDHTNEIKHDIYLK